MEVGGINLRSILYLCVISSEGILREISPTKMIPEWNISEDHHLFSNWVWVVRDGNIRPWSELSYSNWTQMFTSVFRSQIQLHITYYSEVAQEFCTEGGVSEA